MHVRSIQHAKETDDDVEFATDMEEPVCEGCEEHNHQQERHITVVLPWISQNRLKRDNCRLDNSLNTEQLWRSLTAWGKNGSY